MHHCEGFPETGAGVGVGFCHFGTRRRVRFRAVLRAIEEKLNISSVQLEGQKQEIKAIIRVEQ